MVKLIKLISGCLLGLCLVIWDSMSSITVAEFQVTSPILSYDHQIVAAAAANLPFLYAAYTIAWGIFFIYIIILSRKQKQIREELKLLRSLIQDKQIETNSKCLK